MAGTEREFDALLADGIASSEKELFNEAIGLGDIVAQDESGDRSLEDMGDGLEGQQEHDADDDGEDDPAETRAKAGDEDGETSEETRDKKTGQFKPREERQESRPNETPAERGLRKELTNERAQRKAVEASFQKLQTDMDAKFAAMEARLAQPPRVDPKAAAEPAAETPKPTEETLPDRWIDPEGYDRWNEARILRQVDARIVRIEQERVAASMRDAFAKHGDTFKTAYAELNSLPGSDPFVKVVLDRVRASTNPGETVLEMHKQLLARREIGDDPAAFKERTAQQIRESLKSDPEFRKQFLAELRGEASGTNDQGGRPRTSVRLPPSLSSAQGGSSNGRIEELPTTDRGFLEDALNGR